MKSVFYIGKMDCATEEQIIHNRLGRIKEIDELEFDLMNRVLTVNHRLDDELVLMDALNSIGMRPELLKAEQTLIEGDGHDHAGRDHGPAKPNRAEQGPAVPVRERWLMAASGVFALGAEVYAWFSGQERSWPVIVLAIASMALGGRETLRKGFIALKTFTLNINFLMTIAIIGAAAIGEWPEAAMVVFFFGVAEMIEAFSLERAHNAIRSLMELSPELAWVKGATGD